MEHTLTIYRGSATGEIQQQTVLSALGPHEALVRITHASLCGTDQHFLHHPHQTLGHEGVGYVEAVGEDVQHLSVGCLVGLGYIQRTCGKCENCTSKWSQYCPTKEYYGSPGNSRGCFASRVIWDAAALIPIPDGLTAVVAASLMCSGSTVWTVLTRYGIRVGDRVGVLGIGGLGHLAIRIGAKMGYHVVALSGSESKRRDCLELLGAREFYAMDGGDLEGMEPLNHLLICGSALVDYKRLFTLMAIHGTIYPLTVSFAPVEVPMLMMIDRGLRIQGSLVSSHQDTVEMLQFCAKHQLSPVVTEFPLSKKGLEKGMRELEQQRIRYKAVFIAQEGKLDS